jgi:hypothetical protein
MKKRATFAAKLLGFLNRNTNLTIDRARPGASGVAYDIAHVSDAAVNVFAMICVIQSAV